MVDGDPGYVIGCDPSGNPRLLPVQGSSAKPLKKMTLAAQQEMLEKVKRQVETHGKNHGNAK